MVHTIKDLVLDKDTSHNYVVNYNAYERKDDTFTMTFHINLLYPSGQAFNIDDYEFFKELITTFYGEDYNYDMDSLKKFIDTFIATPETNYYDTRDMGPFKETVGRGEWNKTTKFVEFKIYLAK